ncbi:MAG: hypothetical protein QOF53_1540 [Nocardioidaceae bacterium]|nr:hypothetical protein [Nocardioidaceae bacterium]
MPAREWPRRNGPLIAWVVGLVVLASLVYWRTDEPHLRHSSALNAVFDARWLVAGSRLLAAVVLVYLLISIGVRVHKGQWVRSAGSLDTDATPAQVIADDREELRRQLVAAKGTIDDLTDRLERSLTATGPPEGGPVAGPASIMEVPPAEQRREDPDGEVDDPDDHG